MAVSKDGHRLPQRHVELIAKGFVLFCSLASLPATWAQERNVADAEARQAGPPESFLRQYKVSREDEDWRWLLSGTKAPDELDPIKAFRFSDGPVGSLGGEIRARYEAFRDPLWGLQSEDDLSYWLVRARLHGDIRWSNGVRVFGALQSAGRLGRDSTPRPSIDKNAIDVQQLFIDVPFGRSSRLRLGRQELSFGYGRMISPRAGPINVRQPQDGVRATLRIEDATLDLFAVKIANIDTGAFDDSTRGGNELYGVYWTKGTPYVSKNGIEAYWLRNEREFAVYFPSRGMETRDSLGLRAWFGGGQWKHDVEAIYQYGDNDRTDISAWAISTLSTRAFDLPGQPQLEVATGINSGDKDPIDQDINTFVAPLPRGAYFGQFAPFGPGNMLGGRIAASIKLSKGIRFSARLYAFWRQSKDDGLYGVSGFPVLAPLNDERFVGLQPELALDVTVGRHATMSLQLSEFDRGRS